MTKGTLVTLLILTVATEGALCGYVIGKYRLDEKAKEALKQKATDAIAYAKAVPPALPSGYRFATPSEVRDMSDSDLVAGRLVKIDH